MPGSLTGPYSGFTDRAKGKGVVSSSWLNQIGRSTATVAGSGNIAVTASAGIQPGTINNDNVLAAWLLPANLLDIAGRGVEIYAAGSVANNTNSKRIKIFWGCTTANVGSAVVGGTLIADSGAYTTAGAAGWSMGAQIYKYGALGSNTQIAIHQVSQIGATAGTLGVPTLLTAVESGAILVAVTGNAVTATADLVLNWAEVFATN